MLFDDPANLNPAQILDWLAFCSHGLEQTRQSVRAALPSGVYPAGLPADRLAGLNSSEIDEYFSDCQRELDLFAVVALISSGEARIRLDARDRVHDKGNFLGQRFSELFRAVDSLWKVSLYENGIMDVWKEYIQFQLPGSRKEKSQMVGRIGQFKAVLDIRHWVAHGRYWTLRRDITTFPPHLVAQAIEKLYEVLGNAARQGDLADFL